MTVAADVERCLDMYDALGSGNDGFDDEIIMITIPGAPWSKARPRFGNGRTFVKHEDIDAEKRTATYLRKMVRTPFTGNVFIGCLFFRPNRQRIDTDNLIKHVCDAANGVLWKDDSQCTGVMGVLELDPDNPRTVMIIGRHETTLTRGSDDSMPCQICGKLIIRTSRMRGHPPKTCSRECSAIARGYQSLTTPVPCTQCGQMFKRTTKTQHLCSTDCLPGYMRDRAKAVSVPFSRCVDCDSELTHRRGGRCRDCWKARMKQLAEAIP
jgi:Holliday junction resolvase RusA-like endonuclease